MKLEKESVFAIMKAYKNLGTQAKGQFDASVNAVIQTVRSLLLDMDVARLEQALSQPILQSPLTVHPDLVLHASSSKLSKATQLGVVLESLRTNITGLSLKLASSLLLACH